MSAVRGPPKLRQHRHMQANCKCFAATSTLLTVMDAAVDTDHAGSAVWWAPARAVALIRVNAPIRQILTCKQPGPAPRTWSPPTPHYAYVSPGQGHVNR